MTAMFRTRVGLFVILLLTLTSLAAGCASGNDFNKQVSAITKSYKFSIVEWELRTLAGETGKLFTLQEETTENATAQVTVYFNNVTQIKHLEASLNGIRAGTQSGNTAQLQLEIDDLRQQNKEMTEAVSRTLERLARDTLSQQGIYNPVYRYTGFRVGFPPVNVHLADPPCLLIISPRDRIESIKKVTLLPEMSLEEIERIEEEVDRLGVSSLVEGLGGMSTFPSYVDYEADLRFTVDTMVHEWLHQYLAFTPLGFRYILDQTRIRPDYEIATINETVVDIVSKEIGAIVCETYFPQFVTEIPQPQPNNGVFDFNKEMREIRKVVDDYLAWGEIEAAEAFMEQKRQYLAENGYYIRKLNQAYFAFHGTYADSPTSISPIGADLNELREQSVSVKAFLDTVSVISSREDLTNTMEQISSPD
jgi:hypothetical protein